MGSKTISPTLRWLFFIIGIGTLISAGIYLHIALAETFELVGFLRAVMFFLLGLFFILMYGENNRS